MRPAVIVFAPLLLLPFLACADTPAEPQTEETASFKAEKPPKDYGDWVVIDVQCSGPHSRCYAYLKNWAAPYDEAWDCHHYDEGCASELPYVETPGWYFLVEMNVLDEVGSVCTHLEWLGVDDLNSLPMTWYCAGGDNIVGKVTLTRVIND